MAVTVRNQHPKLIAAATSDESAGKPKLRATWIDSADELRNFAPEWMEFLDRGTVGHHVHSDPQMIAHQLHPDRAVEPRIVVVWSNGKIACVAPFYRQSGRFQLEFSIWKMLSLPARALRLFGERIVFSQDADQRGCLEIVLETLRARRLATDYLRVDGLERCDPLWRHGIDARMSLDCLNMAPVAMRSEKNHRVNLPETFDQYLATLSPSTRQNLRRTSRRFFDDGQAKIAKITQPSDVDRWIEWRDQIDQQSWQGRTFQPSRDNSELKRSLILHAATLGVLQSYVLLHDDQPVAYEHGYHYRGIYYGLDCAYDQTWFASGPGSVLMFGVIQDLIEERHTTVLDFGLGDMPYKRSFGAMESEASTVFFVPRNRWRYILRLQTMLNSIYDGVRNALVRLGLDRLVRKLVKRRK
jgi:CelD/BcsL family acetyltransferase involved in cellulose biosynthesis